MSKRKYEVAVDKGEELLDNIAPKWRKKITKKIDMSNPLRCVAAQIFDGWYSNALIKLFPTIPIAQIVALSVVHGFTVKRADIMRDIPKKDWRTLGKEWDRRLHV